MSKNVNPNLLSDKQTGVKFYMLKKKGKIQNNKKSDFQLNEIFIFSFIVPDAIDDDEEQRTIDLTQSDIKSSVDIFSAQKRFDLELPLYGPYQIDYTRNGR
jgi:U3 small nucleolar RNA-associated protein 7